MARDPIDAFVPERSARKFVPFEFVLDRVARACQLVKAGDARFGKVPKVFSDLRSPRVSAAAKTE